MPQLNLTATTKEEYKIKAYLEANASNILAKKINNGVRIHKDGKMLINKKTLAGFLKFACDEAKKQAEKGASSACIVDDTMYGWSVHYFEEDSIEGTLYNEDGTEYKAPMPKVTAKVPAVKPQPKPQPKPQMSMFDLLDAKPEEPAAEEPDDEPTDEDYAEAAEQFAEEAALQADPETGEVIARPVVREPERNEEPRCEEAREETEDEFDKFDISAFDTEALAVLDEMFGNEITLR